MYLSIPRFGILHWLVKMLSALCYTLRLSARLPPSALFLHSFHRCKISMTVWSLPCPSLLPHSLAFTGFSSPYSNKSLALLNMSWHLLTRRPELVWKQEGDLLLIIHLRTQSLKSFLTFNGCSWLQHPASVLGKRVLEGWMEGFYGSGLEGAHNTSIHILLARLSHMTPPGWG